MKKKQQGDKGFISSVSVGAKGQIVIPKAVRDMFDIEPGDMLVLMASKDKGIAIQRPGFFSKIASAILSGHGKELYPDVPEEESILFANALKDITEEDNNDSDQDD